MNHALRRVSLICLVLFVLLLVNVNYVQGFEASSLANEPGNGRTFTSTLQFQRGSIITADQKIVAFSKMNKTFGEYQRHYPFGKMYAPITGYDTLFSQTGIEQTENKELSGSDPALAVHNLIDLITGKQKKGATVQLTINSVAQQAAYNALKTQGKQAGVVALNPQTGAVLATASYPSFDPNQLATLDGNQLNKNDKRLLANPNQPLLNRALNATFPPGSSFKVVTSSTAMTDKGINPNTQIFAPTQLKLPGAPQPLVNFDGEACGNGSGRVPLITAFTLSCNTAFGNLGLHLSAAQLQRQANLFGFNNANLTIPLPVTPSNFPLYPDPAQRAGAAIGQESDTVTPLQEAMIAAAIANQGTLMKPYMVEQGHRARSDDAFYHAADRTEPSGDPGRRDQCDQHDDPGNPVAAGHRARQRGHAGDGRDRHRGEDRHRPERDQQQWPGRRGVHLFCPSQQPEDSRRRRG